jgi:transcription initiation factor TFIID TATA-box-binding protein
MTDVQVENIVVAFSIASSLDLQKLAGILPDAKYNPAEVPALVLQFVKPRSIATLFPTGNVVVTGPRSMTDVSDVLKMVQDRLSVVGVQMQTSPEVKVQNVTASTDLARPLDMRFLVKSLQHVEYDAKVFPGVVYKGDDPNTVILLFDSGKIICNGASINTVTVALEKMLEKLLSFGIKKEEKICQK